MGEIFIISGPSGSGKSTLLKKLFSEFDNLYFSISSTTRKPREGEKDGVNYYFIDKEEFERGIKEDEFLEYAYVHGNYYGTSLKPIKKALQEGKTVIFDIDVQGHKIAREKFNDIITSVFLTTKDSEVLKQRLTGRSSDDPKTIETRLCNAKDELLRVDEYDYLLINDDLDLAYDKLRAIFLTLNSKTKFLEKEQFVENWSKIN